MQLNLCIEQLFPIKTWGFQQNLSSGMAEYPFVSV